MGIEKIRDLIFPTDNVVSSGNTYFISSLNRMKSIGSSSFPSPAGGERDRVNGGNIFAVSTKTVRLSCSAGARRRLRRDHAT